MRFADPPPGLSEAAPAGQPETLSAEQSDPFPVGHPEALQPESPEVRQEESAEAIPARPPDAFPKRLALVHDWLNQIGGAEGVLEVLHAMFPDAPVYTAIADPARVPAVAGWDLRSSWMDRLPGIHAHHQPYLPLYPAAWRTTRLRGYDLVLSNKSGFCHGVDAGSAVHVCYCLTPTRYVWEPEDYLAHEDAPPGTRALLELLLPTLRRWEIAAAARVDRFVAISNTVRDRVAECYGRDAAVIYPPVDLDAFRLSNRVGDFYLVLARLIPYKRIDLAVEAFNQLGLRLVVVGDGRDRSRLEALAGPTIEFRGRLPQAEVAELLATCRALIWPGVEDFGLAPVEAMASGRPVIARRAGGVLDTVAEGRSGLFFDAPEADALAAAVLQAEEMFWDPLAIQAQARQFGRPVFEAQLRELLADAWHAGKQPLRRPGGRAVLAVDHVGSQLSDLPGTLAADPLETPAVQSSEAGSSGGSAWS